MCFKAFVFNLWRATGDTSRIAHSLKWLSILNCLFVYDSLVYLCTLHLILLLNYVYSCPEKAVVKQLKPK